MDREYIKKLIPLYLDGELEPQEKKQVEEYITAHPELKEELEAHRRTWDMLSEWEDIEPQPGYVGRFWTNLSLQKSWHEKVLLGLKDVLVPKELSRAVAAICVIFLITATVLFTNLKTQETEIILSSLSSEEMEFLENIELAENFDIIEDLEFLEDLEIIENLNGIES